MSSFLRDEPSSLIHEAKKDFFFSGLRFSPIWFFPVGARCAVVGVDFQGVSVDLVLFQNCDELLLILSQVERCEEAPRLGLESCDQNFQESSCDDFDFEEARDFEEEVSSPLNGLRLGIFQPSSAAATPTLHTEPLHNTAPMIKTLAEIDGNLRTLRNVVGQKDFDTA